MTIQTHQQAKRRVEALRNSFSAAQARYERAAPGYKQEALRRLVAAKTELLEAEMEHG